MEDRRKRANVYSIPPDAPFLKTLARHILNGDLLPEGYDPRDPLALSEVSVYLPTQRSKRLFEEALLAAAGSQSLLLPKIRALGESDEDEMFFDGADDLASSGSGSDVPAAISPLVRQLILTRLVMRWGTVMEGRSSPVRPGDRPLLVPASPADAAHLAANLGKLLDRAASEGISWNGLSRLVPDDYAAFWQMNLEFLKIATEAWPAVLSERGMIDEAVRRDLLIAAEGARLANLPGPVIAAGSTGTLPATARFLASVARLPAGALVLPGLDLDLSAHAYSAIGGHENRDTAIGSHPQYGLRQLLKDYLAIEPGEVRSIGLRVADLTLRTKIVSAAMLPAPVTDTWLAFRETLSEEARLQAFADAALIDAKNDAEEACAIACALREFVEENEGRACLVTPDRALARRVALELGRWNLRVDDSAGRPLAKTAPAILAELIVKSVASDFDPVALLSLLKHPLASFGLETGLVRRGARVLDLALLRGPRVAGGIRGLARYLETVMSEVRRGTARIPATAGMEPAEKSGKSRTASRLHPAVAGYRKEDWQAAEALVRRLREVLAPLEERFHAGTPLALSDIAAIHLAALNAALATGAASGPALEAVLRSFDALCSEDASSLILEAGEYPKLFHAFLSSGTVREPREEDPRVSILGALEARLLSPDLIVLAGLDEGTWPKQAEADAFLPRAMSADLGFEMPERRIGLAAHDICQGLGTRRILLSRAAKRAGSPTVMSRWLQRLLAFAGPPVVQDMSARGARYLALAAFPGNSPTYRVEPARPPNPKPPLAARPDALSVTRIETWVRDPYAIYAERILGLTPIDPLGNIPGFAERGTIVHEALDRFSKIWNGVADEAALMRLHEIGQELFDEEMRDFPDQRALWWPRFQRIAKAYLNWERDRNPAPLVRHSELYARLEMKIDGLPFTLSGALDRLDELADGTLSIVDFKTGEPPSAKQVKSGLNAQLALEVAMQRSGAFDFIRPLSGKSVSVLGWVKLDGKTEKAELKSAVQTARKGEDRDTPDDLGRLAQEQLFDLVRQYRDPARGYMSRARPDFDFRYEGPYDHLARVKEWQLAEEGEDI